MTGLELYTEYIHLHAYWRDGAAFVHQPRAAEHRAETENSAVAEHVWNLHVQHRIDWDNITMLDQNPANIPSEIREAIDIRRCRDREWHSFRGFACMGFSVFCLIWFQVASVRLPAMLIGLVNSFCNHVPCIPHCIYKLSVLCVVQFLMKVSMRKLKHWRSKFL